MKKNNAGFSLIELMLALLISSMIIAGLFSTLYQVGLAENTVTSVTDAHQKAALVFTHLERDIMGAFIPEQIDPLKKPKDAKGATQEDPAKAVDKIFWGKSRDEKNLEQFTFITSNPLEVYLGAKNSKPKPRVARVIYRLEPQKGVKDSFVLTRQEGTDLFFDSYKKTTGKNKTISGYEMAEGIASFTITYLAPDNKKEATQDQEKKKYERTKNWNSEIKKEKAIKTEYKLPEFVEIELVLWDTGHEKKFEFTYTIPIMFQKDKPKQRQSSPAVSPFSGIGTQPALVPGQPTPGQPIAIARAPRMGPPSVSAQDGKKINITKDEQGRFVMQEVAA